MEANDNESCMWLDGGKTKAVTPSVIGAFLDGDKTRSYTPSSLHFAVVSQKSIVKRLRGSNQQLQVNKLFLIYSLLL